MPRPAPRVAPATSATRPASGFTAHTVAGGGLASARRAAAGGAPRERVPGEAECDEPEPGEPDAGLDPEREPETAGEARRRHPARVAPARGREPERREVRDRVVDEHGEGAEGP